MGEREGNEHNETVQLSMRRVAAELPRHLDLQFVGGELLQPLVGLQGPCHQVALTRRDPQRVEHFELFWCLDAFSHGGQVQSV
jgi:hypothetical protein